MYDWVHDGLWIWRLELKFSIFIGSSGQLDFSGLFQSVSLLSLGGWTPMDEEVTGSYLQNGFVLGCLCPFPVQSGKSLAECQRPLRGAPSRLFSPVVIITKLFLHPTDHGLRFFRPPIPPPVCPSSCLCLLMFFGDRFSLCSPGYSGALCETMLAWNSQRGVLIINICC